MHANSTDKCGYSVEYKTDWCQQVTTEI